MVLVTGTKRSGTSMWMQILQAAGLPLISEPYSGPWERSIHAANPRGFHESRLRNGVYFATNPHPETGEFLFPKGTRRHVAKVFVPGLVRTDYAYIDRVVATMRHWRDYGPSLQRLYDMEDAWILQQPEGQARVDRARAHRGQRPMEVDWWFENYELVRDVAVRRYPVHLCTYESLLEDPQAQVSRVLAWIGGGDVQAAVACVEPKLRTQARSEGAVEVEDRHAQVFEALYQALHTQRALQPSLLARMNTVNAELEEAYGRLSEERDLPIRGSSPETSQRTTSL